MTHFPRLGPNIAKLRCLLQLSQREFGEGLGVCKNTVARWENGKVTPSLGHLVAMCRLVKPKWKLHKIVLGRCR